MVCGQPLGTVQDVSPHGFQASYAPPSAVPIGVTDQVPAGSVTNTGFPVSFSVASMSTMIGSAAATAEPATAARAAAKNAFALMQPLCEATGPRPGHLH